MKKATFGMVFRLVTGIILLTSLQTANAQTGTRTLKTIFARHQTYEAQMLKALGFNPTGRVIAYDEQPRPWAQLSPLEQVFGELALKSAEILAVDLTPGYTADKLISDIGRINEFKGRTNGILSILVMSVVRNSSASETNPAIIALANWSREVYRSIKIRSAK